MAASQTDDLFLFPDNKILGLLFPDASTITTIILSQADETCTFIARIPNTPDLVVRLEVVRDDVHRLRTVSALQTIASITIPHLVPKVERTGTAEKEDGVTVEFSLMPFVPNTVTLESVWDQLPGVEQAELMKEVGGAMKVMGAISRQDERVQSLLRDSGFVVNDAQPSDASSQNLSLALGSPHFGYAKDTIEFLKLIIEVHTKGEKTPSSTLHQDSQPGSVSIISAYDEIGRIDLSASELAQPSIVFCHGDLEPRNILVRPSSSSQPGCSYEVAAIIDWGMAGFFPMGYDYAAKDSYLGVCNQSYTWYSLFKQEFSLDADDLEKCGRLMQAVDIVLDSEHKRFLQGKNVSAVIRERWLAREQLERLPGALLGWTRKPNVTVPTYTKKDNDELELEVLEELGWYGVDLLKIDVGSSSIARVYYL